MLKAIDEEEFDYINQSLLAPVDRQDFLDGKIAIVKYDGSEIPEEYLGQPVHFLYQDQPYEITVGAVTYETYYSGTNIGATLIVSQNYLKRLTTRPDHTERQHTLRQRIRRDPRAKHHVPPGTKPVQQRPLRRITLRKHENHTGIPGQHDGNRHDHRPPPSAGRCIKLCEHHRKRYPEPKTHLRHHGKHRNVRETDKPALIREGILYASFSVLLTLTAGSAVTYLCFQSMNYMEIPLRIPVLPLLVAIALVTAICAAAPPLSYKSWQGIRQLWRGCGSMEGEGGYLREKKCSYPLLGNS